MLLQLGACVCVCFCVYLHAGQPVNQAIWARLPLSAIWQLSLDRLRVLRKIQISVYVENIYVCVCVWQESGVTGNTAKAISNTRHVSFLPNICSELGLCRKFNFKMPMELY